MILVGKKLKELRKSRNLTQKQMGKILGVAISAGSSYESNSRRSSYEVLVRYARIFNISADFILGTERQSGDPKCRTSKPQATTNAQPRKTAKLVDFRDRLE